MKKNISICICTFNRPKLLEKLLKSLANQYDDNLYILEIIVVDNDYKMSAKEIVDNLKLDLNVRYYCEPQRNISLARNKAVSVATGDLIAFIDDDEYPSKHWLKNLYMCYLKYGCDGVLGPVRPKYEVDPPKWIIKSKINIRPEHLTGTIIGPQDMRTGNVLIRSDIFKKKDNYFNPKYGLIGGGDIDFFQRMIKQGYRFIWCQEAIVYEFVSKDRLTIDYHLKRALARGASRSMSESYLNISTLKSLGAVFLYFFILPLSSIVGLYFFNKYLIKLFDHLGKLIGFLGIRLVKERPYKKT